MKNFFYVTTPVVLLVGIIMWAIPPYEVRKERRESKYLTNEQIVEKTRYCEDNGLQAKVEYFGGIKDIHCSPKTDKNDIQTKNIKKSNITEVNVQIPYSGELIK